MDRLKWKFLEDFMGEAQLHSQTVRYFSIKYNYNKYSLVTLLLNFLVINDF